MGSEFGRHTHQIIRNNGVLSWMRSLLTSCCCCKCCPVAAQCRCRCCRRRPELVVRLLDCRGGGGSWALRGLFWEHIQVETRHRSEGQERLRERRRERRRREFESLRPIPKTDGLSSLHARTHTRGWALLHVYGSSLVVVQALANRSVLPLLVTVRRPPLASSAAADADAAAYQ
jgi:hypothetical protein